jgi:hypothetical protein
MTDNIPEIGATDKNPSLGQDRPVLTPHTQIHTLVRRTPPVDPLVPGSQRHPGSQLLTDVRWWLGVESRSGAVV